MQQNLTVRSSNVARILLDGQEIGLLQSVRPSDDYAPEPASGIGNINVQEYVPTMARHTISVGFMALRNTSLYQLGLIPENGQAALKGLIFDIEIFDKIDGTVTRKYLGVSYASGDITITKHAIIGQDCQFNALDSAGLM